MTDQKNKPSRTWVYTLNNYTDDDIKKLELLTVKMHRCCKEIGENKTPHLQGAITFKRAYRLPQLKKLFPTMHWEPAKVKDPENYCIKGEVVINEINSAQGKRTDLELACKETTMLAIAESYPTTFVKYHRGFAALHSTRLSKKRKFAALRVVVLWGKSGVGKTRKAWEIDQNLYNVAQPNNGSLWWDGYEGEETILLDDFYGWIRYSHLLQLLDGYQMKLPYKGGFTYKAWKTVIITSNEHPEKWYQREEWNALKRRITEINEVEEVVELEDDMEEA